MKVLVDEMRLNWVKKLNDTEHDAFNPRSLIDDGTIQPGDPAIREYAKQNGMVIITDDAGMEKKCQEEDIKCIRISHEEIFKSIVEPKLKSMS